MLEVSQRLLHRQRTVLASDDVRSNGRNLLERAASGGAQAIGRPAGAIEAGRLADLVALRDDIPFLDWADADTRLDSWIFGAEECAVSDVWSAGRHIVTGGQHISAGRVRERFHRTMTRLRQAL